MDMTPTTWILIVLLVLLIAVGVFMLTRKPASRQDRNEDGGHTSTDYAAGGQHVAAGDAGAAPSAPLYDQEADTAGVTSSVEDEPIEAPEWQEDDSLGQDTATGGDIEIVEEEPVISATEDVEPIHAPADPTDHGDREQMTYGDPQTEDFASETVYAEAPIEDYTVDESVDSADTADSGAPDSDSAHVETADIPDTVVADDHDDVPGDAAAAGFVVASGATGATAMGSQLTSDDEATDDLDPDSQHGDESTYEVGSADEGAIATDERSGDQVSAEQAHEVGVDETVVVEEVEIIEPEVAFADGPPSDEVIVDEVVVDEVVIVDDPSVGDEVVIDEPAADESAADELETRDDDQPQIAMVDVNDYGTHESAQPDRDDRGSDQREDDHREGAQRDTDEQHTEGQQSEQDTDAPVAVEEDHRTEVVEQPVAQEPTRDEVAEHPATQEPTRDEVAEHPAAQEPTRDEVAEHPAAQEPTRDEVVEEPADEPNPLIEASPYGTGSALADDDGQGPAGYDIKGNAGSMLFHTPESPSYGECTPEVFFESEDAARAAGFAHWDRKRR